MEAFWKRVPTSSSSQLPPSAVLSMFALLGLILVLHRTDNPFDPNCAHTHKHTAMHTVGVAAGMTGGVEFSSLFYPAEKKEKANIAKIHTKR